MGSSPIVPVNNFTHDLNIYAQRMVNNISGDHKVLSTAFQIKYEFKI